MPQHPYIGDLTNSENDLPNVVMLGRCVLSTSKFIYGSGFVCRIKWKYVVTVRVCMQHLVQWRYAPSGAVGGGGGGGGRVIIQVELCCNSCDYIIFNVILTFRLYGFLKLITIFQVHTFLLDTPTIELSCI